MSDQTREKQIGECDCCGFDQVEVSAYQQRRYHKEERYKSLCDLCAGTMAGNAYEYPEQFSEGRSGDVMRAVCYVGNAILAAIAKAKGQP